MPEVIHVILPGNIFDYLDYQAPDYPLELGVRVLVSFRGKKVIGLVYKKSFIASVPYRLQPIINVIDETPLLSKTALNFMQWLSNYYHSPLSDVYRVFLPKKLRQGEVALLPTELYYQSGAAVGLVLSKNAKKQQAFLSYLSHLALPPSKTACLEAGFSSAVIKPLLEKGLIDKVLKEKRPLYSSSEKKDLLILNKEQNAALSLMNNALDSYQAFLLFGVTGSGKTEVYFRMMDTLLAKGKQVLILVPEIGLTPQFLNRIMKRFDKVSVALLHSKLNDVERLNNWLWCKNKQADILIGTRSAVFTPLPALGLIIIDEEHDLSFKQQEGMRFSGRDVALKRAFDLNIPIILGSATPSLESMHNANNNKYKLLRLTRRAATSEPTFYRIVDLRNQSLTDGLCDSTRHRIKTHLDKKQQVLVFINRRGYAPILICHQCGWMADCKNCTAHLTVHEKDRTMRCHHCGYRRGLAHQCDDCQSHELVPLGAGTERLANHLTAVFPEHKVLRVDRDTTKGKSRLQESLAAIDSGDVDVLVGTQLLAKGHHFKKLTLVVVVDADAGFYSQDFRAIERLGQVITQVAGRAGREGGGEVVIQTHHPDNPLLMVLIQKGYEAFSQKLLEERLAYQWPPYTYLALCRAQDFKSEKVVDFFLYVKKYLTDLRYDLTLLGPAPAPLEKKSGQFQLQLLIRSSERGKLLRALSSLRGMLRSKEQRKLVANLRFSIDVDPQDLS